MLPKQPRHLAGLGVASSGFFAVDQDVAHGDLEPSAAGGDQGQGSDGGTEGGQKFVRQTDGSGRVVSHHAVFDADRIFLHGWLLSWAGMMSFAFPSFGVWQVPSVSGRYMNVKMSCRRRVGVLGA